MSTLEARQPHSCSGYIASCYIAVNGLVKTRVTHPHNGVRLPQLYPESGLACQVCVEGCMGSAMLQGSERQENDRILIHD